jgi:hypothetical protein
VFLHYLVPELHINIRQRRVDKERTQNESGVYVWRRRIRGKIRNDELSLIVFLQYSGLVQRRILYD